MSTGSARPVILFGAFDRHNFGDLLFPHLLTALLPGRELHFAGLAARDLTRFGGHRVRPLDAFEGLEDTDLVHVGGEILGCRAYEAAVMLLDADAATQAIARYDADPAAGSAWAATLLGTSRHLPYVAPRAAGVSPGRRMFNAVGGVGWGALADAERAEARLALRRADWLGVRDHVTHAALKAEGVDAALCPDPAVMVRECCGEVICERQQGAALRALVQASPQGFLACQFSGDFADDASLGTLAKGLSNIAAATGMGVVLFRAGAAPWHDDRGLYDRLTGLLPAGTARIFDSLHLWDICGLIAASRAVVASSLHARLVAAAYGLPRVSLQLPQQGDAPDKRRAFVETWEPTGLPGCVPIDAIATATLRALAFPDDRLRAHAALLAAAYRERLGEWTRLLPAGPGAGPASGAGP